LIEADFRRNISTHFQTEDFKQDISTHFETEDYRRGSKIETEDFYEKTFDPHKMDFFLLKPEA
jgi:hypothetical protein